MDLLERIEKVLGIIPCDECEHGLSLHFNRDGCDYERGDRQVQEVGAVAMGPCGCKAASLSDDGKEAFLLLRDIRQMRILRGMTSEAAPEGVCTPESLELNHLLALEIEELVRSESQLADIVISLRRELIALRAAPVSAASCGGAA